MVSLVVKNNIDLYFFFGEKPVNMRVSSVLNLRDLLTYTLNKTSDHIDLYRMFPENHTRKKKAPQMWRVSMSKF